MPQRANSSGMGHERKRTLAALAVSPESPVASSTSSAFSRQAYNANQGSHTHWQPPPRSPSPPASAYFPLLSADHEARLRPTADAEAHFAYSTTLRRHHLEGTLASPTDLVSAVNAEASGLWQRAIGVITGQPPVQEMNLESGRATPLGRREEPRDTLSARFAHCSIEVGSFSVLCEDVCLYPPVFIGYQLESLLKQ